MCFSMQRSKLQHNSFNPLYWKFRESHEAGFDVDTVNTKIPEDRGAEKQAETLIIYVKL